MTIPSLHRLLDKNVDLRRIEDILYKEADKKGGGDIDLIVRSWTLSGGTKEASRAIENFIEWIDQRKARIMQRCIDPPDNRSSLSIKKRAACTLSRDRGKTCVVITEEDVERVVKILEEAGRPVTLQTVHNYCYETMPHKPFLSEVEQRRMEEYCRKE